MFELCVKIPRKVAIAVSGGCDSMAALDFLKRSHELTVLHFNHGTKQAKDYENLVSEYCQKHDIEFIVGYLGDKDPSGRSLEDFWREHRYKFFEMHCGGNKVITCHHLDDVVETWLFGSLHGTPKIIPKERDIYIRPFLATKKEVFRDWSERKRVPYIEDESNRDICFMRNYIRHEIVPKALHVNPGLHKVMKKKVESS